MPRTPKSKLADLPTIPPELLESFGNGPITAEAINVASILRTIDGTHMPPSGCASGIGKADLLLAAFFLKPASAAI